MSRAPRKPSSTKPVITSGDLRKSETQPIFATDVFPVSNRETQSCPDVLFDAPSSSAVVKKNNSYYVIDFYPNAEWGNEAVVTRVADRLLQYSNEDLKKFSNERVSKTDLLKGMVGVRKINRDERSETQFKLIRTDKGVLFWRKVESADKLYPFEKLLFAVFDFRSAALIMQDYCDKIGENFSLQEDVDQLSEKLLSCHISLENKDEIELFFNPTFVKNMLSAFQTFNLLAVSMTTELWQLLRVLQNRDSFIPENLRTLVSLSPNLYSRVIDEIAKMQPDAPRIFLPTIVRAINIIDRSTSPVVLPELSLSSSLGRPVPQSENSSGSSDAMDRANESSPFLTVRAMTLFPRSSSRMNLKSPKTSDFSPVHSPRRF